MQRRLVLGGNFIIQSAKDMKYLLRNCIIQANASNIDDYEIRFFSFSGLRQQIFVNSLFLLKKLRF